MSQHKGASANFEWETFTRSGSQHGHNEDAIAAGEHGSGKDFWMLVADGMGGHRAGDLASQLVQSQVENNVSGLSDEKVTLEQWVTRTVQQANKQVYEQSQSDSSLEGMGSTCVLAVVRSNQLVVGWVGDSRAYLVREGQVRQLTRDHSAIQYLLDKGSITQAEAERSNTTHLLSRAIGIKAEVEVELITENLQAGDMIMLSSDGLHDSLSMTEFESLLKQRVNRQIDCQQMAAIALDAGSRDDISCGIIIRQ